MATFKEGDDADFRIPVQRLLPSVRTLDLLIGYRTSGLSVLRLCRCGKANVRRCGPAQRDPHRLRRIQCASLQAIARSSVAAQEAGQVIHLHAAVHEHRGSEISGQGEAADAIAGGERDPSAVTGIIREVVGTEPLLDLEYAECVRQSDLAVPGRIGSPVLLAVAAHAGSTRLIDNLPVTPLAEKGDD